MPKYFKIPINPFGNYHPFFVEAQRVAANAKIQEKQIKKVMDSFKITKDPGTYDLALQLFEKQVLNPERKLYEKFVNIPGITKEKMQT